jgi:hypothetical protein
MVFDQALAVDLILRLEDNVPNQLAAGAAGQKEQERLDKPSHRDILPGQCMLANAGQSICTPAFRL